MLTSLPGRIFKIKVGGGGGYVRSVAVMYSTAGVTYFKARARDKGGGGGGGGGGYRNQTQSCCFDTRKWHILGQLVLF